MRLRYGDFDPNVFTRWQRDGKVKKLRNGLYLDAEFESRGEIDRFLLANALYPPSYISLHSALRYYNFIPESVYEVTSITPRKTKSVLLGNTPFSFRNVKSKLFFGFRSYEWRGEVYHIASPEKALLDLAYFYPEFEDANWLEEMRFDVDELEEQLDWSQMWSYGMMIDSKVVYQRIANLLEVYDI